MGERVLGDAFSRNQKSFRACGISVNTDGTEDEEIHCFKEGGVAADARESIQRDTITLATGMDSKLKESNPFTCYISVADFQLAKDCNYMSIAAFLHTEMSVQEVETHVDSKIQGHTKIM